jgi:hypothetical protein
MKKLFFYFGTLATLLCTAQNTKTWPIERRLEMPGATSTYKSSAPCSPGTTNISCNSTSGFNLGSSGYVGSNPTAGDSGCNPCCYSGADLDCDGLQDVPFSVENSKWYVYCNSTSAAITININVDEPGSGSTCNLQGACWVGSSLSTSVMDCGNSQYAQYDSNPGGAADGFTFTPTVPAGQCAYIMIDGYGGSTCTGAAVSIVCPVPLPVEIRDFKVRRSMGENVISWATASEKNSKIFVVERSTGTAFKGIGAVDAAGSSTRVLDYELKDASPYPGVNYYRLRLEDLGGNFDYSSIIMVNNSEPEQSPVKIMNLLGQEVTPGYEGIKIYYYADGSVVKKL